MTFQGWGWDWKVVPACSVLCKQRMSVSSLIHVNSQGERHTEAHWETKSEREWDRDRKREKQAREIPSVIATTDFNLTLLHAVEHEGAQVGLWQTREHTLTQVVCANAHTFSWTCEWSQQTYADNKIWKILLDAESASYTQGLTHFYCHISQIVHIMHITKSLTFSRIVSCSAFQHL